MRKENWFIRLVLLFVMFPMVELYLLYRLAETFGWMETFAIILSTGLVGAYLAKKEGREIIRHINIELGEGRIPGDELLNGMCVLIGGALLLTPGIITDLVGLSLIFPLTRRIYKKYILEKMKHMIKKGSASIHFIR